MKRFTLALDESVLDEAYRLGGERTISRTVGRALREFVRRGRAIRIRELTGSGAWRGDLTVMRKDRTTNKRA
jgi:hypothetical protein